MSETESKKQILKSTGILGASQVIIIAIGIVRVKVLAILLGATGVGIAGLYQSTIDLIKSLTGFGIGYSAVRDIAASAATNDEKKIAETVVILRRLIWITGILGMIVTIVFSKQLSIMAFGDGKHSRDIAILSLSLPLLSISSGYGAIIQGFRNIGDMAKANTISSVLGLFGAAAIYYFFGIYGIVPALLFVYLITLVLNWYYSRQISVVQVKVDASEVISRGKTIISLGFFMTLTGLASTGTMYLVRAFLSQEGGLESVGHFVAAWSISSMYISAIFGAMGADFFPRLSRVQHHPEAVTSLVNEQTEIAILITTPIIIGMVSFIDIVVWILYSKSFGPTGNILDWQLIGDFFKVLAWPIGFILLAKGKGRLFISAELLWNILYIAGVYFGWKLFGIEITGIAFFIAYFLYLLIVLIFVKSIVGFTWSGKVKRIIWVFMPLLILSFLSEKFMDGVWKYFFGVVLTFLAILYSYYNLKSIINFNNILRKLKLIK